MLARLPVWRTALTKRRDERGAPAVLLLPALDVPLSEAGAVLAVSQADSGSLAVLGEAGVMRSGAGTLDWEPSVWLSSSAMELSHEVKPWRADQETTVVGVAVAAVLGVAGQHCELGSVLSSWSVVELSDALLADRLGDGGPLAAPLTPLQETRDRLIVMLVPGFAGCSALSPFKDCASQEASDAAAAEEAAPGLIFVDSASNDKVLAGALQMLTARSSGGTHVLQNTASFCWCAQLLRFLHACNLLMSE